MRGGIDMQSGGEAFLPQFQTAGNSQISRDFHSCVSALAVGGGLNALHSQSCQTLKGHFDLTLITSMQIRVRLLCES